MTEREYGTERSPCACQACDCRCLHLHLSGLCHGCRNGAHGPHKADKIRRATRGR